MKDFLACSEDFILDKLERLRAEVQKVRDSQTRIEKAFNDFLGEAKDDSVNLSADVDVIGVSIGLGVQVGGASAPHVPFLLPENWPGCLALRVGLEQSRDCEDKVFYPNVSMPEKHAEKATARRPKFRAFDPDSIPILIHNVISVGVLMVEFTMLPFVLAWQLDDALSIHMLNWFVLCFWTADVFVHIVTGYSTGAGVELRPTRTFFHYMQHSFALDFVILVTDWFSMMLVILEKGSVTQVKFLRILKLQRVLRFVRLVSKLPRVRFFLDDVEARANYFSHTLLLGLRISVIIFFLVWLYHVMACIFFMISAMDISDTGYTWLDLTAPTGPNSYGDLRILYQYSTSMHWSMSQSSVPGILGSNSWERLFACVTKVLDKVFNVTIVPALAASMMGFQMRSSAQTQQVSALRLFLKQHHVPSRVGRRVCKQAKERLGSVQRKSEKDVGALSLLSPSLLSELRFEILRKHIVTHPLFLFWADSCLTTTQELCGSSAATITYVAAEDDLFLAVEECSLAYYVVSGSPVYHEVPESSAVRAPTSTHVSAGSWLCDAALWVKWTHVGRLTFPTHGEVIAIGVHKFIEVAKHNRLIWRVTQAYASEFHHRVTHCPPNVWPTDLHVPFTEFDDIVSSLPSDVSTKIGVRAVAAQLKETFNPAKVMALQSLLAQVQDGTCTVIRLAEGEIHKMVSVTQAQILDPQGRFLVQLASFGEGTVHVRVQLPDIQRLPGQSSAIALAQLFDDSFPLTEYTFDELRRDRDVTDGSPVATLTLRTLFVVEMKDLTDLLGREVDTTVPSAIEGQSFGTVYVVRGPSGRSMSKVYKWCDEQEFASLTLHSAAQIVEAAVRSVTTCW